MRSTMDTTYPQGTAAGPSRSQMPTHQFELAEAAVKRSVQVLDSLGIATLEADTSPCKVGSHTAVASPVTCKVQGTGEDAEGQDEEWEKAGFMIHDKRSD